MALATTSSFLVVSRKVVFIYSKLASNSSSKQHLVSFFTLHMINGASHIRVILKS